MSLLPRADTAGDGCRADQRLARPLVALLTFLPARMPAQIGDKLHKVASVLALPDGDAIYRRLLTHWEPDQVMPGTSEPKGILWDPSLAAEMPSLLDRMQFLDLVTYLPDDILTKVDRASMAVALEARVPLLDHRVVEFAWALPQSAKIRGGKSKWLLRQVLYRHVPPELVERPKMGFGIPLGEWLRGPFRDWAETLLSEQRLREAGLFDTACVRRQLGRAPQRAPQLATSALGHADVRGLARTLVSWLIQARATHVRYLGTLSNFLSRVSFLFGESLKLKCSTSTKCDGACSANIR